MLKMLSLMAHHKLYGDKVLDLLPEEDPQDIIDDPDLRNWLF